MFRLFPLISAICAACLLMTGCDQKMASEVVDLMVDSEDTEIAESETELSGPELWDTLPMLSDVFVENEGKVDPGLYITRIDSSRSFNSLISGLTYRFSYNDENALIGLEFNPQPYTHFLDGTQLFHRGPGDKTAVVKIVSGPSSKEGIILGRPVESYIFEGELIAVKYPDEINNYPDLHGQYVIPEFPLE